MKELQQHPLINNMDSKHYQSSEEPAIVRFERKYSVQKLMAWAEITMEKYADPARAVKGQKEADIRKYETYKAYYNMLLGLVFKDNSILEISAEKAYKKMGIEWSY